MNNFMVYFKLRTNSIIEGDIKLVSTELSKYVDKFEPIDSSYIVDKIIPLSPTLILSNTRKTGVIGFIANVVKIDLSYLVMRLNFIQEIWVNDKVFINEDANYP